MSIPLTEPARVLVVDDEQSVVDIVQAVLEERGMTVLGSDSGESALELLEQIEVDVVLTDICMEGMDGFELTSRLREHDRTLRVIAMTGHDSYDMLHTALDAGMHGYLQKPMSDHEAIALQVRRACDATRMERTNATLVKRLRGSLSRIASMNEALEERNAELAHAVVTDPLTGLNNRARVNDLALQAVAAAHEEQQPLSLLQIELDRFRVINDRFGQMAGDDALRRCATLLHSTLERLAPNSATLGRLAGTEFLVVLRNADVTLARSFGEWLRQAVGTLTVGDADDALRLTASLGASTLVPVDEGTEQDNDAVLHRLYRESERALAAAVSSGRDRVTHHAEANADEQASGSQEAPPATDFGADETLRAA